MRQTKKSASPKQLAANRINAARSTGTTTPEGKANSARNSLRHGFATSSFAVVRLEDSQEIDLLKADLAGDGDIGITRTQNRNYYLATGFHRLSQQSNSRSLCLRYKVLAERQYRHSVEEFDRLKTLRHEIPNPFVNRNPKKHQPVAPQMRRTHFPPEPAPPVAPHPRNSEFQSARTPPSAPEYLLSSVAAHTP